LGTVGSRQSAGSPAYEAIVDVLLRALTDPEPLVGVRALRGLGRMAAPRALEAVAAMLSHPRHVTREAAVRALFQIDADRTVDLLIDVLHDADAQVRAAAAVGLSAVRSVGSRVLDALTAALADPDALARGAAMGSLVKLAGRDPDVAGAVVAIAGDGLRGNNAERREISLELLRQLKVPGHRERCLEALTDQAPVVRARAVLRLAFVPVDQEIVIALLDMRSDPDDTVRESVARTLVREPARKIAAQLQSP
jgi:HEAT repeat protein